MLCSTFVRIFSSAMFMLLVCGAALPAFGQGTLRIQKDLRGDMVLIGNTLIHDCASLMNGVVEGEVAAGDSCNDRNANAPEAFWRSGFNDDFAVASSIFSSNQARSVAVLNLPAGAVVDYARLYWAGFKEKTEPDREVRLQHTSGLDVVVTAGADASSGQPQRGDTGFYYYQASAEVTDHVRRSGNGPFAVLDVETDTLVPGDNQGAVAAWHMVVFYELDGEPKRNLAIFDGLTYVDDDEPAQLELEGFEVPGGFDAKLAVVAYDGQDGFAGDSLSFNGTRLGNAMNPVANFFNGTRSALGRPVSVEGDQPRLTGTPGSYANVDMDVVDVTDLIEAGQTSATIEASAGGGSDVYLLGMLATSISTLTPVFTDSLKSVEDLNGGLAVPGDTLRYTITIRNTGTDLALDTRLRDEMPEGTTYVPGSLRLGTEPDAETLSDTSGDDLGEYDASTRTVVVRVGDGANASDGGDLDVGEQVVVSFEVTIDEGTTGEVRNQGLVNAVGDRGAPDTETETDSDPDSDGQSPTVIDVHECAEDADCPAERPSCDTTGDINVCVGCVRDSDCTDPAIPDCDVDTQTCHCPDGAGQCQDSDGDGVSDGTEEENGTDPHDADSDDDGALDGEEFRPGEDTDGDGLVNGLDPDSDDDGLFDGTEIGNDCGHPDTNPEAHSCRPDRDRASTTSPIDPDTDNGGMSDGSEDTNFDGRLEPGETDPNDPSDDLGIVDTDQDGLSDGFEDTIHSDRLDADTDEDGVPDGEEPNPSHDGDGDGLVTVLDVDSDDDGLFDGTETGRDCDDQATNAALQHCIADEDDSETTSPVKADTDDGGVSDGSEDSNLNGRIDSGETDPNDPSDDGDVADMDEDGLSDDLEATLGTDPRDADTDDDGLLDGDEHNPADDTDRDGRSNVRDSDSDGDGLKDGTEAGTGCAHPDTDPAANACEPDADNGRATTSPVNPDTDFGGTWDGVEDENQNGRIDSGETDPNDPSDDVGCTVDEDCDGGGQICLDDHCMDGCRDNDDCEGDDVCHQEAPGTVGQCGPETGQRPNFISSETRYGGGGFGCAISPANGRALLGSAVLLLLSLALVFRRRD